MPLIFSATWRRAQHCEIGEVAAALLDAPVVARLVFLADEAVGRAFALGAQIKVGVGSADFCLDMAPVLLRRPQRPALAQWIREEYGKLGAVTALACNVERPGPIARRLQRERYPRFEMGGGGSRQRTSGRSQAAAVSGQTLHGRNQHIVGIEMARPGKHMPGHPRCQPGIRAVGCNGEVCYEFRIG